MNRQQYVRHTDRFGNLIEVGDIIIRPLWAELFETEVVKITEKGIYVKSTKYEWNHTTKKVDSFPSTKRICTLRYRPQINFINLTKLKI
jgi:hypothetical protein